MKVAVFGGSFDPVHLGHLAMVDHLLDQTLVDEVLLVPAGHSPFKQGHTASGEDRLAMLQLVFGTAPGVQVETRELERPGPSYTIDTLTWLVAQRPGDEFFLVIGRDNLNGFSRWRDAQGILDRAGLIVFARHSGGDGLAVQSEIAPELNAHGFVSNRIVEVNNFDVPVSSREVRGMLSQGLSVEGAVPGKVIDYIDRHALYGRG